MLGVELSVLSEFHRLLLLPEEGHHSDLSLHRGKGKRIISTQDGSESVPRFSLRSPSPERKEPKKREPRKRPNALNLFLSRTYYSFLTQEAQWPMGTPLCE